MYLILCFFATSSLIFRPYLMALETPFEITALIEFVSVIRWEPGICTLYINPSEVDETANYSFPQPIVLQGFSSSPLGWKIALNSDYANINNEFLLVSEDRQHFLRYVFTSNQNAKGNYTATVYKHQDTVMERSEFASDHEIRTLYATLLGGQAKKVPGGYYTATVTASFYDQ